MKSDFNRIIRLGLFVTAALVFLTLGVYFIGQKQRMFTRTFTIRTIYKDVNGLQVGNNVRFSGINVGTVNNIEILNDTSVQVDLKLERRIKRYIKKDAQTTIGSEGLMGDKLVTILPGNSTEEVENNGFLKSSEGNGIDAIMSSIKVTADNAAHITSDLAAITSNIHQGKGTVGKLFMDTAFAENLDKTLVNVKQGARGFNENMQAVQHNVLLRPYFKKKEKEKEKEQKEEDKQ